MLKFQMVISKIIEEGKQQRVFRPNVNINHVADILVGIYFYTLFPWLEGKLSDSLTTELLERVELLMHGIKS